MSQHVPGPIGRTSYSVTVTRKIKRGFRRIALRPIMAVLLMMTLLLLTQPWTIWADGANTLKEPINSISSRIKPSEMIGGVSDWLKNLKRLRSTKPVVQRSARKLHVWQLASSQLAVQLKTNCEPSHLFITETINQAWCRVRLNSVCPHWLFRNRCTEVRSDYNPLVPETDG